ncbi:MAG: BatA domain-containing protein [Verrucomicrobiales bacterium]
MSFLNIILLGGMAAFSLPLIIHILNKRRFKQVQWGAMHLLAPVVRKNNQRIRLEQLLLLLIRIAIPVILALCLARPVLTSLRQYGENAKTSTVFLLDDSFSMQDGTPARSNFSRAREEIGWALGAMRDGSDSSVILFGGRPEGVLDEPTTSRDNLASQLKLERGGSNPVSVGGGLLAAAAELDKMEHAARDVVIVSDFQASDWGDAQAPARQAALEQFRKLKIYPNLTLYQMGDGPRENASIESVDVSSLVLGVGQRVVIRANLKNFGKTSYPDLVVVFKVDGVEQRSSQVTLAPGQESQVLFSHTFEEAGSHHVEVMGAADSLKADNRFVKSLQVWDEVPVLLVDGAPSSGPLEGEAAFLELALQPFGSAGGGLNDLITSQVVAPGGLNENSLKGKRVVVLANVAELHGGARDALSKFVGDGGALIIFPGDRVKLDWYNRELFRGGEGLMPQEFVALAGGASAGARGARETKLVNQNFAHPALAFFNDPRNGKLDVATFSNWFRLGISEASASKVPASLKGELQVLARFDTGEPFLVERPFGQGKVILAAAPADASWSNFPTQPIYLPVMQRLVTYLAAGVEPPRNVAAGSKLVAFVPGSMAGQQLSMTKPGGGEELVEVRKEGARGILEYNDTAEPGIYTLADGGGAAQYFAVNLDRRESDVRVLDEDQMKGLAIEMEANLVTDWDGYTSLDKVRRTGIEFWKPLLYIVLALVFAELIYQQWLGGRKLK